MDLSLALALSGLHHSMADFHAGYCLMLRFLVVMFPAAARPRRGMACDCCSVIGGTPRLSWSAFADMASSWRAPAEACRRNVPRVSAPRIFEFSGFLSQ
jgi:hypothetical protein